MSSWLARIADVYLVSLDDLQSHVGWERSALELELEPVSADLQRIAAATTSSLETLYAMTFHTTPPCYRGLLRLGATDICPECSRAMQRRPRLKSWSFAFAFWCDRHRQPLFGFEMRGVNALGDEVSARRGAEALRRWALEADVDAIPIRSVLALLLLPARKAAPPAPWELARLPPERQREPAMVARPRRRPVLSVVVPEFRLAVPIYDQRLPTKIADVAHAPWAERYALAIGVGRILKNPVDTIDHILRASDACGRKNVMVLIKRWPLATQTPIDHAARGVRGRWESASGSKKAKALPGTIRAS